MPGLEIIRFPIYQSAFQALGEAVTRWRKGLADFPVLATKRKGDSFTVYKANAVYPKKGEPALPFTNRVVIEPGKKIDLPGVGTVRSKEKVDYYYSSQTFTVSRTADKWFVSSNIDAERVPPIIHKVEKVGIDLGIKTFATLSDNSFLTAPESIKKAKTKLSKVQWQNKNKQFGNRKQGVRASNNAKKFFDTQSQKHAHIANIRRDFLQKTTTEISKKYYKIRVEDLNVSGMVANHKLADALSSLGLYEFRRMLDYKQSHYGTKLEVVDRWYPSSKTCSKCGHVQDMKLSDRVFNCGACNFSINRDLNAAINLEKADSYLAKPKIKKSIKKSKKKSC
ncbi:transposase [Dulcicalothrix desertica PCC 7102]|uniref:Transposase n=1 Tax=Dulcicalothrix desertica PCC 7102 TaxID=232991 RepID=A0A3S1ALL4_9CYAN|nr:RNA-guided endonuclease TnpB family protein [Dulcicalothrix desertica]RUT03977.1 transposase [Dulcicalothrix desertica PCC 7102]